MFYKKLIYPLIVAFLFCFSSATYADGDPVLFLKKTTDELLSTLSRDHDAIQKNPKLIYQIVHQILIPKVDTASMSRSVLGPVQWRKLTPEQQTNFEKEFIELVIRTYSSALSTYKNEKVGYYPLRESTAGKVRIQVRSVIIQADGRRVPVNYWLSRDDDNAQWKVYDISVEGVSLLESFRSQFSSELSQVSFDQFLKNLQQHNQKNA